MKVYNVYIQAMDDLPITERTGKSLVYASTSKVPKEGGYHTFFYNEDLDSMGVAVATDNLEIGEKYWKFVDYKGRQFFCHLVED